MKINNNLFICALLVLMLFLCINASSAVETLDTNITSADASDIVSIGDGDVVANESGSEVLGAGELIVGDGGYSSVSAAVGDATGGEKIFIKNGEALDEEILGITDEVSVESQVNYDVYVSPNGDDGNDGSSLENAVATIYRAYDLVPEGGSIYLLGGNHEITGIFELDKSIAFVGESTANSVLSFIRDKKDKAGYIDVFSDVNFVSFENMTIHGANSDPGVLLIEAAADEVSMTNCIVDGRLLIEVDGELNKFNANRNYFYHDVDQIISGGDIELNLKNNIFIGNSNPFIVNNLEDGTIEYNYANEVYDFGTNWVKSTITASPEGEVDVGSTVTVTVDFNSYGDANTVQDGLIPDYITVKFQADGNLSSENVLIENGIATVTYTNDVAGTDTLHISIGGYEIGTIDITSVVPEIPSGVIYVSTTGNDANNGLSEANAVASLNHAIDIANVGQIIILPGEYTVTSLLNVTKDLNITGEGDVLIKSNSQYQIEVYDDWEEEWTSETHYTLIENNANLNLTNIRFNLVRASISDAYILNNANLLVNSCEFNNIKVTSNKGVIQNIKTANLKVNGTTFQAATGTYGGINNNGELLVNNSKFLNNDRSSEGGVYSTAITSYNKATVLNSEFTNNKGTAGGAIYVMYSYTNKANPVMDIDNCTFNENVAAGTSYTDGYGAAIRCGGSQVTLTVSNSTFNKNNAKKGGAIYTEGTVTVNQCVFIEDTASFGEAVYVNGGTTNVQNSIILDGTSSVTGASGATLTANDNWWGTNDKPNDNVETWVTMDASFDPANAQAGDEVTVTATFDNDKLPSGVIDVTFTSTSGNLNTHAVVIDAQATATYTIADADESITATSGNASVVLPIQAPAPAGAIYVSYENGDDNNNGLSEESSVKTIAHAIELADAGTGKIILLEGTHVLDGTLFPTKDLDITGQGVAVIDGNRNRFIQTTAGLNLTNIEFTNGYSSGSNLINLASSGTYLSLDKVKFYNNGGKYGVAAPADKRLIINNSEFYDNNLFAANQNSLGVIYSNSAITTIENTLFRNNIVQKGGGIWANRATSATIGGFVDIINCTFDGNIAQNGQGAAIFMSGSVTVTVANSTFTNNLANKSANGVGGYGSAVYIGTGTGKITITQSTFINNTGNGNNYNDAGFYIGAGTLNVSDSIILTNDGDTRFAINQEGGSVTAENNWWGNNDEANTNAVVDKIVTMTATLDPEDAKAGDEISVNVVFDNENLPKGVINVSFTSSSGSLNQVVTMQGAQASVNYAGDASDVLITVKSSQAKVEFKFDPDVGIVFVLPGADDTNPGTRDAPVGTIAHALELASEGKIILLEGIHKTGDLGIISNDLTIAGEGNVVIDANNNNRILYVGEDAKVVISNVTMINGYTIDESGALLGNSNELTLINCTLAKSSAPQNNGGAIFSVGKLTLINTTIANCTAIRGGAIYTQIEMDNTRIDIFNSTFENNIASGKETWGGGAIYAQRTGGLYDFSMTIDNASFNNNKAQGTSCGGAIQIEQLVSTVKISNSEFISNHANGKDGYGGGAIYTSSPSSYERQGTMTITGSLFENNTCDSNGGAIFAKTTTVNVANSVLINNTDSNGLAFYGLKSETTSPSIILNDNWWGSNDSPKNLVGGNGYKPTLNRWAILTVTNASEIVEGETVQLTVSINNYTDGTNTGALSKPITVKRAGTITTTFGDVEGVLKNGEWAYDLTVPAGLKYIAANVDDENVILYVMTTNTIVAIDDIAAKKFDNVEVTVNVTSDDGSEINVGNVELYIDGDLIATIPVSQNKAIKEILFTNDEGIYNLTAKYVDETELFGANQTNATLTISGIVELTNSTFLFFFDEGGNLKPEYNDDELVFHGDFSDLGVDVITIPKSVAISGDNAVLYGMAIFLEAESSKVCDMKFIAEGTDFTVNRGAVILATAENIELNNVSVIYAAPNTVDAYAVYAYEASGFKLIDSVIVFDSSNAGAIHHAVHIANSDDINVTGNTVNASLPARDINWHWSAPFFDNIDQDTVLAIGIQGGNDGILTENEVNVKTKSASGFAPTIDSIIVYGVTNLEISWNNITHVDTVNAGEAGYSNAIDLYAFDGVTVKYNNVLVNSTAGTAAKGTAYPIQATGPYVGLLIDHNNLTSISNGPALGIYSQNYDGLTDIVVTNNNINATGIATENVQSLVSGMELQDTNAKVYNNTIYSQSKGSYDDLNALYGISYAQETEGDHTFDIKDNNVFTEGKYAVYLLKGKNSNITDNTLYANDLKGDDAAFIDNGNNNIIENNRPYKANITVEAVGGFIGTEGTVTVTIHNATGIVTIEVNGKSYDVELDEGVATKVIPAEDLVVGENIITVTYSGDDNFLNATANATLTVTKANSTLTANDTTLSYLTGGKVVATLKDVNGNPISGVEVIAVINDASEALLSDANGDVYLDIIKLTPGNYTATFTFAGNDYYMESNATANVVVGKEDTIITLVYDADANEVIATLTTVDGLGLSHTPLIINVDGVDHKVSTNSRGVAKLSLADLVAGNYNITGTYKGNDRFNSDNETININVTSKMDTVISLVYDANAKELVATLTTNKGLVLDLTPLIIDIDGVEYNVTTDSDGVAKVSVADLAPGVYNASAAFEGNDKFNPSDATKTLYVNVPMDTVIDLVYDEEANELVATLTNIEGLGLSSTTVNINVAGEDYVVKTNNRGVAKLSTADLKPGVYNATASFNGNSKFKSSNATAVVNTRIDTAITLVYDEAAKELVATLNIVEGSVLTGTTVNINVDGVDYAVKTNSRGVAKLSVADLAPGSYVATATYNGNYKYDTAEATINMRVKTETAINLVYDETAKELVATLNTADGGPLSGTTVNINVDGVDYAVKTSSRGVAKVSTADLAPGSYVATASYNGNYRFGQAESSINMRVKTETVLSAVYDADVKELSVTLTTAESGPLSSTTVNINIDGVDYAVKTSSRGVAKLSTVDLAPGSYTASISYAGNYRFCSGSTTIDIEV